MCMYVCVRMHIIICTNICTYVCTCVRDHTNVRYAICVRTYVRTYWLCTYMCKYMCVRMHKWVCTNMCKYVCTCACYHICMCTYVRTCRITYMYIFVTIFATILLQTYLDIIKWSDTMICWRVSHRLTSLVKESHTVCAPSQNLRRPFCTHL